MVSTASGRASFGPTTVAAERRSPIEGWGTLLLHAVLFVLMAESISHVERGDRLSMLVPLALGGGAIGLAMAKARTLDLLAHMTALVFGLVGALLVTAVNYGDIGGGWRASLQAIDARAQRFIEAFVENKPLDDDLLVATIGVTIWLVAYCSAWMLYRRRWLGPSVMLPGVVMLTSLGLNRDASPTPIYAYLAVAMVLAARHFAFRRQQDWRRQRLAAPTTLPNRFLTSGIVVAVAALAIGISLPVEAPDEVIDTVSERANQGFEQVQQLWERLPFDNGNGKGAGNYAQFPEEFEIGAPIDLTDDPVAILRQTAEPSYLAVRRYNVYDGHTWSTDVDETFWMPNDDDDLAATRATFQPMQAVSLSPNVRRQGQEVSGEIKVLREKGGLLFTLDTYLKSSEQTTVSLSWQQLNGVSIPIHDVDRATVPRELDALLAHLQQAEFAPALDGGEPVVTDRELRTQIELIRQTLRNDYPLQTRLELVNGEPILYVDGRVPVYDDIEAVYQNDPIGTSDDYLVTGLRSTASPTELRRSSTDYPRYVEERYLQLPGTVTDRTRQLAAEVVAEAGADNPFDAAIALQDFLRTYPYTLDTPTPPDDRDFVDDFLFESKVGRCEHYATAMIVMLRSLGIPARLVNGYNRADFDPSVNGFLYREKQAHTWVEAYFPGYGWIPFEPTPSEDEFNYGEAAVSPTPSAEPSPSPTPEVEPTPTPTEEPTAEGSPSPVAGPVVPDNEQDPLYQRALDRLPLIPTLIVLSVLALFVGVTLAWLWGLRGLRPGAALYVRALRIARFWGVRPNPTMTPSEFASEFGRTVPGTRSAMRAVAEVYSEEQYGPPGASGSRMGTGRTAWRELRGTLLRWRPWRRRPGPVQEPWEAVGD